MAPFVEPADLRRPARIPTPAAFSARHAASTVAPCPDVFVVMAAADQFVHGWDLAKATGQTTDLDPELAAQFLDFYRAAIADEFRGSDPVAPFGPLVTVDSSDSVAQLVAVSGRTP